MKIRKVIDICVKSGNVELRRAPECQWVGDGGAQYAFYNLPVLNQENAPTLFDIPAEKAQMVRAIHGLPPVLCDVYEEEVPIERDMLASRFCPDGLVPFSGRTGLIFIKQKYLTPFKDDDRVLFFERSALNKKYKVRFTPYIDTEGGVLEVYGHEDAPMFRYSISEKVDDLELRILIFCATKEAKHAERVRKILKGQKTEE